MSEGPSCVRGGQVTDAELKGCCGLELSRTVKLKENQRGQRKMKPRKAVSPAFSNFLVIRLNVLFLF